MRLKFLYITEIGRHAKGMYLCACGVYKELLISNVRPNKTESCGCLRRERMSLIGKTYSYRHGAVGTPEYAAFIQAKSRCEDKNRKDYKNYGGRGIKFLYKSFSDFINDLGYKPNNKLSLDRINNDSHYVLGNCRWATAKQQRYNQRKGRNYCA